MILSCVQIGDGSNEGTHLFARWIYDAGVYLAETYCMYKGIESVIHSVDFRDHAEITCPQCRHKVNNLLVALQAPEV